jgi:hypothetical protein
MFKTVFLVISTAVISGGILAQTPADRKLAPFHKILVVDKMTVQLVKSDYESAEIKVQGIDPSAVRTEIKDGTLNVSIYGEAFTRKKVMVTLHFVDLKSIAVNNGAEVSTTSLFKGDTLHVELKSGGMLYLDADIECLISKITEGGLLSAEGYATVQDAIVATTGTLSAFELESEKIKIKASSGGKAKINVETELDAEANTKAFISYKGNPSKINKIANSGGSIVVSEP